MGDYVDELRSRQHMPGSMGEVNGGMDGIHIELAKKMIAMGDD